MKYKKFILILVGFAISLIVVKLKGSEESNIIQSWCDGFFVTTTIYICSWLLSFVSTMGGFDSISFGIKSAFGREQKSYLEYKKNKRKKNINYDLLIAGVIFLILTIFLTVLTLRQ